MKNGISEFLTDSKKMIKEKIIPSLIKNFAELKKDLLAYVGKKVSTPLGNYVADAIVTTKSVVTFTANKINNKIIKPIVNRVVKPVYNNIIKPVYNKVVKPFVEPIYTKVIKPTGNWLLDKYNKAKNWLKK